VTIFFAKYSTGVFASQFIAMHHQWQIDASCEVRDNFEKVCDETRPDLS
jgi:hypothetical protein